MKGSLLLSRAAIALVGVGTTVGTSLFVANLSGPASVKLPGLAGAQYAPDAGAVAGSAVGSVTPRPRASGPRTPPDEPVGASARPTPALPTPRPSPQSVPRLLVVIATDHATVHKNDTVTYTIRVVNTGEATATRVLISSHVPEGTILRGWECGGARVKANGRDQFVCGDVAQPPDHPIAFGLDGIAAHAAVVVTFWVSVDHSVAHRSTIPNHTHASASNATRVDSAPVDVIVR